MRKRCLDRREPNISPTKIYQLKERDTRTHDTYAKSHRILIKMRVVVAPSIITGRHLWGMSVERATLLSKERRYLIAKKTSSAKNHQYFFSSRSVAHFEAL
jgi:hypothetical protein